MQIPDIQRRLPTESSDNAASVRRANSAGTQPIREPRRARVVPLPTDNETTIAHLKDLVRAFCEARDWDQFHHAKDLAIGISTEAAELLEHFRFQSEDDVRALFADPARRREIANELADVLIFVLRFGQRFQVDLPGAVAEKLAQNETRYPVARAHGSNRKAERDRR